MERGWRQKLTPFARALVLASALFQIAICMFIFFWNTKRMMLKLSTSRLLSKWISLTSSSFNYHASFIIQIHQLAFLEHTHSVARKYFEFDYSLSICLPLVEWVKYKTSWMYSWLWCNRELLNWAECKTKLRKANDHDNVRFRKIKRGRQ